MFNVKQSVKQTVAIHVSSIVPFSLLKGSCRAVPLIGYYHLVSDEDVLHIKHLYAYKNVKQFKDDIDFIMRNFTSLSLPDFLYYLKNDQEPPDNSFLLTFDDGLRETYEIISPVLLAKGVPAIFFVSSAFVDNKKLAHDHKASLIVEHLKQADALVLERRVRDILIQNGCKEGNIEDCILGINYHQCGVLNKIGEMMDLDFQEYLKKGKPYLTTEQLEQMIRKGFAVGAHGIDHPMYSTLSLDQQLYQTRVSVKFLRERFSLNYSAFAFPHSDHGVSNDFFREAKKDGLLDISFGTAGILEDTVQNHFQRFSLEKPILPVEKIIAFHLTRRIFKVLRGRGKVLR
jgi:peptidoglycan/xylan/chitin deacetylase (PgdA/CDA1 family)